MGAAAVLPSALLLALLPAAAAGPLAAAPPPRTVMWDGSLLQQTQATLAGSSASELQPALEQLLVHADHWKNESDHGRTFSVMSKPAAGPSGDKHDFVSLGTYWWPNPNTTTGLPYVRRDGLVNPETNLYDSTPISQMMFAVSNLSLAYYFTGRTEYCEGAAEFIDAWFLDAATQMNPKSGLEYAQILRGLDKGRGIGIIDAKDLAFVPDSALLLDGCSAWPDAKQEALKSWLSEYVLWLSSSSHATDEFVQLNNHGTWFDVQALSLSMHVGNASWSKSLAQNALSRIQVQVAPVPKCDKCLNATVGLPGALPRELFRTRTMHYTWWDMIAFFELAQLCKQNGVDLFHYETPTHQSLKNALDWIAPWTLKGAKPWPYPEVTPFDHGKFFQIFRCVCTPKGSVFSQSNALTLHQLTPCVLSSLHWWA
jgi:hypothetical protein